MKKLLQFFLIAMSLAALQIHAANKSLSPLGYWKTIDDVTGKPKSIIYIYPYGNVLYGKIVKIFPRPGFDQNEICTACKDSRHNQRIVGMVIIEGLIQSKDNPLEWSGGKILDPLNGKTYSCYITLANNGCSLNVRGYIGFSLFGRSQTWIKMSERDWIER